MKNYFLILFTLSIYCINISTGLVSFANSSLWDRVSISSYSQLEVPTFESKKHEISSHKFFKHSETFFAVGNDVWELNNSPHTVKIIDPNNKLQLHSEDENGGTNLFSRSYLLNNIPNPCTDEFEPDNSPNESTFLNGTAIYTKCLSRRDEDWFRFNFNSETYFLKIITFHNDSSFSYRFTFELKKNHLVVQCRFEDSLAFQSIFITIYDSQLNRLGGDFNTLVHFFKRKDPLDLKTIFVDSAAVSADHTQDGSSWENAFNDLQDALAIADSGDQIWIAYGTYYPVVCNPCTEIDRNISFEIPAYVDLLGGFKGSEIILSNRQTDSTLLFIENPTILSGEIGLKNLKTDNSQILLYFGGQGQGYGYKKDSSIIEGIILETSPVNIVYQESEVQFSRCLFRNYQFEDPQATIIEIRGEDGPVGFSNCYFDSNQAGNVISQSGTNLRINNCIFSNNNGKVFKGKGIDALDRWGDLLIKGSKFLNNQYGFDIDIALSVNVFSSEFRNTKSIVF